MKIMKERTIQILQALVDDFIETANPIASKKLLERHKLNISSATVRNEFAILEEVGFIKSPHVSAGKVPTEKGYRFFVDEMSEINKETKIVEKLFNKYVKQYHLQKSKEKIFDMLRIISQLTGNVAFANLDNDRSFYIGISNVLRSPEFLNEPEKAAKIIEVLEGRDRFQQFLNSVDISNKKIKIFIGEENLIEEISSCAILLTSFDRDNIKGHIGILGPMRMKYGFNKAVLQNALTMIS